MQSKNLLIAIAALLVSCSGNNDKSDAYGNFEATEVIVSSQAQGIILWLNVEEGQVLRSGQYVGLVDTIDLYLKKEQLIQQKATVATRIAMISSQEEVQEQQKKNLMVDKKRIDNLFRDGAATQKQVDDINGAIDLIDKQIMSFKVRKATVRDEIKTIERQTDQVNESLRKCHIKNPVNGTVLTKLSEAGEVTGFGKPLFKIANLDNIKLKVYVSGAQLARIRIGQEVEVLVDKDEKSNRKLRGTITWISQTAEFTPKIIQTKKERVNLVYAVKVSVKNDGTLKIGMPGEINFNKPSDD